MPLVNKDLKKSEDDLQNYDRDRISLSVVMSVPIPAAGQVREARKSGLIRRLDF